ncbi:reverse transcriptase domain-containing protein [Tanacetum coccineum]
MHTCASNYELVEPLEEPERTLNRRHRRRNKRVPFERRDKQPENPREVYPPILDMTHFPFFLNFLEFHDCMANPDDEPMWATDRVVAPTPGPAITIPAIANKFAIKGNHLTLVKGTQFDGRIKTDPHKHIHKFLGVCDMFKYEATNIKAIRLMMFPLSLTGEAKTWLDELNEGTIASWDKLLTAFIKALNVAARGIFLYKTLKQAYQLLKDKVLLKLDWAKNQKPKSLVRKTIAFADEGSSNSDTDKIKARMDSMTMKMDAQYKEMKSRTECNHCGGAKFDRLADMQSAQPSRSLPSNTQPNPRGMPNYGKFLKELVSNKHKLEQISSAFLSDESSAIIQNKVPPKLGEHKTQNMLLEVGKFTFHVDFVILKMEEDSKVPFILGRRFLHTADAIIRVKHKQLNLGVGFKLMIFSIDYAMKHSYSNDDTCFSIDVIDEILEEDFDALLDEGSKILYSIEGTPFEDKIFAEFDEFIAMNIKENTEPEIIHEKSHSIRIIKSRNLLMNLLRILNSNLFVIT